MSVEYYQKVKELQRLQHEREQERMELDQQLNSYLKSGKQWTRFKAAKLQTYWQKICDDERKSRTRNEQLLKEFQRVQTHMDALTARTERLRMLKEQYELQVERMYPRWKERLELKQQQRHRVDTQMDVNEYQRLHRLRVLSTSADSRLPGQQKYPPVHLQDPQPTHVLRSSANRVPHEQLSVDSYTYREPRRNERRNVQPAEPAYLSDQYSPGYLRPQELSKIARPAKISQDESKDDDYDYADLVSNDYEVVRSSSKNDDPVRASNGTKEAHSRRLHDQKPPTDMPSTDIPADHKGKHTTKSVPSVPVPNNRLDSIDESGLSLSSDSESSYHPLKFRKSGDSVSDVRGSGSLDSGRNGVSCQHSVPTLSRQQPIESDVQENTPGEIDSPVFAESTSTPFTSDTEHETDEKTEGKPHKNETVQQKTDDLTQDTASLKGISNPEIDSDSEIGSETSLPLSDDDSKTTSAQANKQSTSAEAQDPSATTEGLWHIIRALEFEIEESDEVDMIYNAPIGTAAIVAEIVREANGKNSLQHLNPNTMSMVVLRELPLIIRKSSGGCLISDKILTSTMPYSEAIIRSYMYSASLAIWDSLLQHFATLLQRAVFSVDEIARKFAPLMIKAESLSSYETKAIKILKDILSDMPLNETLDETVSSIGVTPKYSQDYRTSTRQADRSGSQVPPLDLEGMRNDSEDSEVDSPDSSSDHNVPLNETDAYQQMMKQLSLQGDDVSEEEVSVLEDDEDHTNQTPDSRASKPLEPSPRLDTPPSSTRSSKGKRNVLSSLGGVGSLGLSYGNNEDGGMSARSHIDTGRSENSEIISSLEPTPRESAYVPSAMDQSLKSTGRSDKSMTKRSAAFWGNESDIESESEMTVPMGTGTIPAGTGTIKSDEEFLQDDEDDFDFYD